MKRIRLYGRSEEGMTILELMFLLVLLSLAAYVFTRFMLGTRKALSREDAAAHMLQSSVRSLANLRASLNTSVELLANYGDSTGNGMLAARNLVLQSVQASTGTPGEGAPAPVAFTQWPTVESANEADMNGPLDPGAIEWGDELAYVVQLNPVTFTAYYVSAGSAWAYASSPSSATNTVAEVISAQRYQFVYDYLSIDPVSTISGAGHSLRLTEWRSQPFIAYSSLNTLTDTPSTYQGVNCCPRLTGICTYLSAAGYTYAFNPENVTLTSGCSSCFYKLTPGTISSGTAVPQPPDLPMGSWAYLDDFDLLQNNDAAPGVDFGRIARASGDADGQTAAPSAYSVAFNTTGVLSTDSVIGLQGAGGALQVPAFAQAGYSADSMGGPGFPAGFEVAVDGQFNSREVVLHLALMASNPGSNGPGLFQALSTTSEVSVSPQFDF